MNCPECGAPMELKDGRFGTFYGCTGFPRCTVTGSVHKGTDRILGTPADRETKAWRIKAHAAFDPLWKSGNMTRPDAYKWLAGELGISVEDCHIGHFDIRQCKRVIEVATLERSG